MVLWVSNPIWHHMPALAPANATRGHLNQQLAFLHKPMKPISQSGVGTLASSTPQIIPMHASGCCQGCRHTSHVKVREGVSVLGKLVWASDPASQSRSGYLLKI